MYNEVKSKFGGQYMFKKLFQFVRPTFRKAEEAKEAKKKSLLLLIAGVVVMIVISIIPQVVNGTAGTVLTVIMVPIAIATVIFNFIFFLRMIFSLSEQRRLEKCVCSCGSRFRYPENVTYELGNTTQNTSTTKDGAIRKTYQEVHLTCTCPQCGKVKKFTRAATIKSEDLSPLGIVLRESTYSVEDWLVDFFRE